MSATFAPELKVPSTETAQINVTEYPSSQAEVPNVNPLPQSVSFTSGSHAEAVEHERMFGTHVREAIAIFKDWAGR